jgi:hypothetical protein
MTTNDSGAPTSTKPSANREADPRQAALEPKRGKPAAAIQAAAATASAATAIAADPRPSAAAEEPPAAQMAMPPQAVATEPPVRVVALATHQPRPTREKDIDVNAAPYSELFKLPEASLGQTSAIFSDAAQEGAKTLQAITEALVTGIRGAEQARALLVASSIKALETEAARATAFTAVKSPQEALDLHQQFARQALESYTANATVLSSVLSSSFQAALKPLNARFSEVTKTAAKA